MSILPGGRARCVLIGALTVAALWLGTAATIIAAICLATHRQQPPAV